MSIRMDQPRPFDLVGSPVLIGGIGTGFEANINFRVHDGHDEVTGPITVGGGSGEHAQFQVKANVGRAAFKLDRVFVEVFEVSAKDGTELHKVTRPVLLGSRLVKESLEIAATTSFPLIVVLGHADYYPRFGFEPGADYGITAPWEVPPEVWMVHPLPAYRPEARGMVTYAEAFNAVT